MSLASYFQLLVVENVEKTSARTKEKYQHFKAHTVALDADFKPMFVGHLEVARDAREGLVSGEIYTPTYASRLVEYGDKKGSIEAQVVQLSVVPAHVRPKGVAAPIAPVVTGASLAAKAPA